MARNKKAKTANKRTNVRPPTPDTLPHSPEAENIDPNLSPLPLVYPQNASNRIRASPFQRGIPSSNSWGLLTSGAPRAPLSQIPLNNGGNDEDLPGRVTASLDLTTMDALGELNDTETQAGFKLELSKEEWLELLACFQVCLL